MLMSIHSDVLVHQKIKNDQVVGEYYVHKIDGDGNCFINCFLDCISDSYNRTDNRKIRTAIGSKTRLEFAKFLISESYVDDLEIALRLNIKNAPDLFSLILRNSDGSSSYEILKEICSEYVDYDKEISDKIIENLSNLDLRKYRIPEEGESNNAYLNDDPISEDELINLFLTDPRLNLYYSQPKGLIRDPNNGEEYYDRSKDVTDEEKIKELESYGYGVYPLNIGYYEITDTLVPDIKLFEETLDILISVNGNIEYLQHQQSVLFATFIGFNTSYFHLYNGKIEKNELSTYKPDLPNITLINFNNIHWELIIYKCNVNGKTYKAMKVSDFSFLDDLHAGLLNYYSSSNHKIKY